jgi:hypothetical protein
VSQRVTWISTRRVKYAQYARSLHSQDWNVSDSLGVEDDLRLDPASTKAGSIATPGTSARRAVISWKYDYPPPPASLPEKRAG